MSLNSLGIGTHTLIAAAERVQAGTSIHYRTPSRSTYIIFGGELWDLKPIIGAAMEIVGADTDINLFPSRRYQAEILRMGYDIVRFDRPKERMLGIRGFDPAALADDHSVFQQSLANEIRNSLAVANVDNKATNKKILTVSIFVRNSELRRKVLAAARGKCGACGGKTFKTASGEWFLEVHHKKWLRERGQDLESNMIALCPTCHRQEHYGLSRRYYE